jgi:NADH-quinone oxidoreductase subunit N
MNPVFDLFLVPLSPVLAFISAGLLLIVIQCVKSPSLRIVSKLVGLLGPLFSVLATWHLFSYSPVSFLSASHGTQDAWLMEFIQSYRLDSVSLVWYWGIGSLSFLSFTFVESYFRDLEELPEVLILLQFISAAMMLLVSANSLLMSFMALELMSLPTYVLVGVEKDRHYGAEASLKYFLFGSFASVLMLFSVALIYSYTGTLQFDQIAHLLSAPVGGENAGGILVLAASALFIISVGFKLGVAPFHMWLPDAYEGASTPITGYMGSAIKLAGFGMALRLWWGMLAPISFHWISILGVLSVITMFAGNLGALKQRNLKRLFAYSSVSHAGYLVLGLISLTQVGGQLRAQNLFYYLIIYGFMFVGMFGILALVEKQYGSTDISNVEGLGFSQPVLGLCLAVFVLSAAGIPPTAGFLGKYLLFSDAVRMGHTTWVILAVVSSVIGVYYYLRVIVALYMTEPSQKVAIVVKNRVVFLGILACAVCMILFSFFPHRLGI